MTDSFRVFVSALVFMAVITAVTAVSCAAALLIVSNFRPSQVAPVAVPPRPVSVVCPYCRNTIHLPGIGSVGDKAK